MFDLYTSYVKDKDGCYRRKYDWRGTPITLMKQSEIASIEQTYQQQKEQFDSWGLKLDGVFTALRLECEAPETRFYPGDLNAIYAHLQKMIQPSGQAGDHASYIDKLNQLASALVFEKSQVALLNILTANLVLMALIIIQTKMINFTYEQAIIITRAEFFAVNFNVIKVNFFQDLIFSESHEKLVNGTELKKELLLLIASLTSHEQSNCNREPVSLGESNTMTLWRQPNRAVDNETPLRVKNHHNPL